MASGCVFMQCRHGIRCVPADLWHGLSSSSCMTFGVSLLYIYCLVGIHSELNTGCNVTVCLRLLFFFRLARLRAHFLSVWGETDLVVKPFTLLGLFATASYLCSAELTWCCRVSQQMKCPGLQSHGYVTGFPTSCPLRLVHLRKNRFFSFHSKRQTHVEV